MKSTGIVRKVDELGRVVIPKSLRRILDIQEKDSIEIFVEDQKVSLQKYNTNMPCRITGEALADNISLANGKITLSQEGAQQLVTELESRLKSNEGGKVKELAQLF